MIKDRFLMLIVGFYTQIHTHAYIKPQYAPQDIHTHTQNILDTSF